MVVSASKPLDIIGCTRFLVVRNGISSCPLTLLKAVSFLHLGMDVKRQVNEATHLAWSCPPV
jgi:hypothetical protein